MDQHGGLRDELTTTARQLRRLLDRGAISQQQYDEIAAVLRVELASLEQLAAPPAPALFAAVPAAPSVIEPVLEAEIVEPPPALASPVAPLAPPIARRQPVHPLDRPHVPAPPPPRPMQPRKSLAEVVQSFMEESNIRWMEIIAAVCIVISSVGLVWSLRSTLKSIPYFPAILFAVFTCAFHGAGLYTLRKWKLHAVSRVILVIALLLVPLSFAGAIVMSGSGESLREATDPMFLLVLAAGLAVFGWVSFSGSRELVGRSAWPLALGVLGCSASQVLIHRMPLVNLDFWRLSLLAALPLGSYLLATGGQLFRARRWPRLSRRRVQETLLLLGIATFALAAPLALLLVRSELQWSAVARLSPALSLAAAAALALGLLIHRRTTARNLAAFQTAGTAIVLCAGSVLLMLVAFTWPEPKLLLAVGVINCVVLAALGVLAELPLLYAPAIACAALAATVGLHLTTGHFAETERPSARLIEALLMGRTSLVLGVLGAAVAAAGVLCRRQARRDDAQVLVFSAGGLALVAVLISWFSGFVQIPGWQQDRNLATAMLLAYAAALLAAWPLTKWPPLLAAGSFVFWTALVHALWLNTGVRGAFSGVALVEARPVLLATILHGVLTAAAALVRSRLPRLAQPQPGELEFEPPAGGAPISLTTATPFLLWICGGDFQSSAILAALAAGGWLLLAAAQGWPWAISAFQALLALAPALAVAGVWKARTSGATWWLTQEHLLSQLILLALPALAWSAVRRLTSDREPLRKLLQPPWPAVDQVLLGVAAVGLPLLALLANAPSAGWELGFPAARAPATVIANDFLGSQGRGWIAFVVVLAALTMALWERVSLPTAIGVGLAAYAAVWLAAAPFAGVAAVASAARWFAAIYAAVFAAAFILRDPLRASAKRLPWLKWSRFPVEATWWFGAQPLLLGGLTVLIITIIAVSQNATGVTLRGPAATSLLAAIGPTASYAGPLIALVAILLAYAIREQQAAFALGGAGLFQFAINLAFILYVAEQPAQPAQVRSIEWLQWNSVAAGLYALLWLGLARWITPPTASAGERTLADGLWLVPVCVSGAAAAALSFWSAWLIIEQPALPPAEIRALGHWLSYAAIGLALAAVGWKGAAKLDLPGLGDAIAWLLAALVPLAAASLHALDAGGQWLAYHTLAAGWLCVAGIACAVACWRLRGNGALLTRLAPHHVSAALLAGLVVFLAIRGNHSDPGQPWWSLAGVLGACGIATAFGLFRRSQPYAFGSTVLAGLAVILFWQAPAAAPWIQSVFLRGGFVVFGGWETLVVALSLAAGFWLCWEIESQHRRQQSLDARPFMPRVHAAVVCGVLPLCLFVRLIYGLFLESQEPLVAYDAAAGISTAALGGLLVATIWDRRAAWSLPLLFLWGLVVGCLAIGLARPWLPQSLPRLAGLVFALATLAAVAGQLWSYGANLAAWGSRLAIHEPVQGLTRTALWLPAANVLLTAIVCLADLALVLNLEELKFRVAAALGPAIAAWGLACLAQERRQAPLQLAALLVAGFSAVLLGWAQLDGHTAGVWMERVFRLLMVLAALTFAYGLVLPRLLFTGGSWQIATRRAGYLAGAAAIAAFVATLALEVSLFEMPHGAPVAAPQVIAIAVVLVGLIAGLISMALLPGRDPLLLSERAKQVYVYAAEATGALLFAHLYLCRPQWFDTVLRPYWPFIVLGLAFLGVGAAELFQRLKVRVFAEPLLRTGSLLPLLPVLGMWVAESNVDYALLLLVVGLLYLGLSFTQQSWAALVAAAVAGNGALWTLFSNDQRFQFAEHPQLWLIPPALSVLAAAQVNRHRLPAEALTAIRYAATIVIYVSSTSEIMIKGLGTDLLPPMILLGLSVAGAFAGIALRVRAFLYLGTAFTLLALTSMVWHARRSIDHVWPLWAFGIFLGVGILVLLVLFEKHKAEMHAWLARLRQWEQ